MGVGKNISRKGSLNRRSLHSAPPDFLSMLVALCDVGHPYELGHLAVRAG
jgi:hypothetical protein